MKKASIICAVLFALHFAAMADGGIDFIHDKAFQDILNMAKAQNKLVFMDCYTSWCGPCKRLAAQVFPDSSVGAFFNSAFINTKFDMEKDEGVTIAGKYSIRAYPTLLWLDGDGNVVHKYIGGLDPGGLIQNGKKAVDPTPGILAGMKKKYADGSREPGFVSDYLNTLAASNKKYEEVFTAYLKTLSAADMVDSKHAKTIFNLTAHIKSDGLPVIEKNKAYYTNLMGADVYNAKINQLAQKAVEEAYKASDKSLFESALALVKKNKAFDQDEKIISLSMLYYSHMNDWKNYDKYASQYVKKYASKSAKQLNDIAWTYYINVNDEGLLAKALKWSYQAVNMENKYTTNLTYAYLRYKLNDLNEAEKACDYAILRAKEENVQPTSATYLKDAIQKSLKKQ